VRPRELNTGAGVDLLLAIRRLMVGVHGDEDLDYGIRSSRKDGFTGRLPTNSQIFGGIRTDAKGDKFGYFEVFYNPICA
jgi:hypothetical protein